MICLTVAITLLSTYVFFESLSAIAKMPAGLIHFCHKIKYVLSISSSMAFMYYAVSFNLNADYAGLWLVFGSAGTLAFFVWPRTVYRVRRFLYDIEMHGPDYL